MMLTVTMLGLQAIPAYLATYREKGILRRLATAPVSRRTSSSPSWRSMSR
jgi:hypothetical protein